MAQTCCLKVVGEQLLQEARCARMNKAKPSTIDPPPWRPEREGTASTTQPVALNIRPTSRRCSNTSRLYSSSPPRPAWSKDRTRTPLCPPTPPRYHSRPGGEGQSDGAAAPGGPGFGASPQHHLLLPTEKRGDGRARP
jgi:hypothetical protein